MRSLRSSAAALAAAAAVVVPLLAAGPPPATAAPAAPGLPGIPAVPGLPIPSLPTDALVPQFVGAPAVRRPIAAPAVPQNPFLSANGTSSMHNDAYSTDAYDVSGPLGRDLQVTSASYGVRECATAAFDSRGRLVGLCGGLEGFTMMLIDPDTLRPLDELQLSRRDLTSGANPFSDICGGTYFFLDQRDRAYATTIGSTIAEVAVRRDGTLQRGRTWPLGRLIPADDCLVATTVDWKGLVWVFTQQGRAITLERRTGRARVVKLGGRDEGIFNSVSSDETGGVYAVTTHALYRLDATRAGRPRVTWRERYDRGTRVKPSMLSQGSGTSPTLIGRRWIAIADNADPRTRVLVLDRRRGVTRRLHCAVPVLGRGTGTTENSLVAVGRSVVIENNYGYAGIPAATLGRSSTPGIARVAIERRGCRVAWTNTTVTAPSSVAKASLGNGLLYAYTKEPRADGIDAWYVTALDLRTGRTAWSRLTGTGIQWNNHYAAIYLGPDGTLYVATLAGLLRMEDGR